MFARDSATIPRWRVPPVFGPRGSRSFSLNVVIITDRPSYTVVDCRRPSFSGRCSSCLGRNTTPPYVCTVPTSFQSFLSRLSVVPVKWLVSLSDTLIVFVTYLFTYLHGYTLSELVGYRWWCTILIITLTVTLAWSAMMQLNWAWTRAAVLGVFYSHFDSLLRIPT